MGTMAEALKRVGLVSDKDIQAIEREKRLQAKQAATRRALRRAQATGKPADWSRYATMKRRLPVEWQFAC